MPMSFAKRAAARADLMRGKSWAWVAEKYEISERASRALLPPLRTMPRITSGELRRMRAYRRTHTQEETAREFGRGRTTIQRLEREGRI